MRMKTRKLIAGAACVLLHLVPAARAADRDYVEDTDFTKTVTITFNGTDAMIVNGAGVGVAYGANGASIAITSGVAGVEYVLSGTAADGYVTIESTHDVKLTLNGVNLTSTTGPAVSIVSGSRCFVVMADGTTSTLADGTTYTRTGSGALWGTGPLILSGRGSMTVAGRKGDAIHSATYIRMLGGDVVVPSAVKDGLHANTFFQMDNGSLAVAASGDGIDADDGGHVEINGGAIAIQSTVDDTKGIKCGGTLAVNGGSVCMTVNGVQSKGLKSGGNMAVNGGTLEFNLAGAMVLETVGTYVDPSYCTAMKCDADITIAAGSITITHTGTAGKGISADGSIVITGGTLDIVTTGGCSDKFTNDEGVLDVAAADCLKADGNLTILGGTITALSTGSAGDAISCEGVAVIGTAGVSGTPAINAATRGAKVLLSGTGMEADYANPKAFKAVGNLTFNNGVFTATTKNDGGEGLESKANLVINGGTIEITAYDDCINASSSITINGGMIYCYSTGNDGIDSNGPIRITGGTIVSSGTTAPEEGFDCDQYNFAITGGILVGTGGGTSTPTAASCTQRSVKLTCAGTSGVVLQVKSASGDNLVYKIPRTYSGGGGPPGGGGGPPGGGGMVMLFSNPSLASGITYTIVSGATVTGGTEFHGLYTGATVTGGTTKKTFTATSMVTSVSF